MNFIAPGTPACVSNRCRSSDAPCPTPELCRFLGSSKTPATKADDQPGENMVRAIGWVLAMWCVVVVLLLLAGVTR